MVEACGMSWFGVFFFAGAYTLTIFIAVVLGYQAGERSRAVEDPDAE